MGNLLKSKFDFNPQVTPPAYTATSPGLLTSAEKTVERTSPSTENISKLAEDIFHVHAAAAKSSTIGACCTAGMTKLIITLFFLSTAQHFVCFCSLLEIFFGLLITRIFIRMIFYRHFPVCLLDLIGSGIATDTKDIIIISFPHC